jgi:hypothetical protein
MGKVKLLDPGVNVVGGLGVLGVARKVEDWMLSSSTVTNNMVFFKEKVMGDNDMFPGVCSKKEISGAEI